MLFWKALTVLMERIRALVNEANRNGWNDDAESEAVELNSEWSLLASVV